MNRERITDYLCSVPERSLRSLAALAGGMARTLGEVALPARVRRSRLYYSLVESTLRFLIENLGNVQGTFGEQEILPDDFLVRRAAGNLIELAGLATFRASPVWVFAVLADLSGAGRDLVAEIAAALESEGLLEKGRRFDTVDQLLDGLERTAGRLAETVNTPPLDVASLRDEWDALRAEASHLPLSKLPSTEGIREQWRDLQREAERQGRPVWELSSAMALATVRKLPEGGRWLSKSSRIAARRTGEVLARGLLDHYRTTLAEIRDVGFIRYWVREFAPYLKGSLRQFSPRRTSATERLLERRRAKRLR